MNTTMTKNQIVQVIPVKNAPKLTNTHVQSGIRDKAAAENWGAKHGHSIVYFMVSREKVYAERCICAEKKGANPACQASHIKRVPA